MLGDISAITTRIARSADEIGIEEKVRFLGSPDAFPGEPGPVTIRETHMSFVFVGASRVLKIKKPIHLNGLDLSTLPARQANCFSELRLNRRLAGGIYRAALPLVRGADGRLALDEEGEIVDWVVEMDRLPEQEMLDRRIEAGTVGAGDVARLGRLLASFYARSPTVEFRSGAYSGRYAGEIAKARHVFAECGGGALDAYAPILDRLEGEIAARAPLLESRALRGAVVDAHGDLRPEHVCLTEPIVIFDCLEFSAELRALDPVDEIAFLGMECEMLDADWIGPLLLRAVMDRLEQQAPGSLPFLYGACRAVLRARLCLAHLLDPVPRQPEKWRPLADRYMTLAKLKVEALDLVAGDEGSGSRS